MSEELSRVKSRQKKYKGEQPPVKEKKRNKSTVQISDRSPQRRSSSDALSRKIGN